MLAACKEVGPALFFSLLIITVSFLPVFSLEGQEGRLFSPLAYTKTFSMAGAALLSITLVPVLMMLFIRGKIMPEAKNPVNRFLIWVYRPIIAGVMRWKKMTIALALLALGVSIYPAAKLGSEFMPTLNEGTCSTCRLPCRACRSPRPRNSCRRRTRSSRASPRSARSTARPVAPTRRPTRRRPKCSRR
jgi:Cu/Ag efflux pump CusA